MIAWQSIHLCADWNQNDKNSYFKCHYHRMSNVIPLKSFSLPLKKINRFKVSKKSAEKMLNWNQMKKEILNDIYMSCDVILTAKAQYEMPCSVAILGFKGVRLQTESLFWRFFVVFSLKAIFLYLYISSSFFGFWFLCRLAVTIHIVRSEGNPYLRGIHFAVSTIDILLI